MKLRRIVEMTVLAAALGCWSGCSGDEATSIVVVPTSPPVQPTDTPPPTEEPTQVPTLTATRAAATATNTSTQTPTSGLATATVTPTAEAPTEVPTETPTLPVPVDTPTPTPTTMSQGLGIRALTVMRPGSHFLSSALAGFDVSLDPWLPGPLLLEAGTPDASGVAPLKLAQDAILGCPVLDNSVFCVKLFAEGSSGTIACNGGVPQGVAVSQDSHADQSPGPLIVMTGQGEASPPGSASISIMHSFVNLPVGSDPSDCANADFSVSQPSAMTTATATGTIENPVQGGTILTLAGAGTPFDCSDWTNPDGPGKLVDPIIGLDIEPVGDVVNLLVMAGQQEAE